MCPLNRNKPLSHPEAFVDVDGDERAPRTPSPPANQCRCFVGDISTPQRSVDIRRNTKLIGRRLDDVDKARIKMLRLSGKVWFLSVRN